MNDTFWDACKSDDHQLVKRIVNMFEFNGESKEYGSEMFDSLMIINIKKYIIDGIEKPDKNSLDYKINFTTPLLLCCIKRNYQTFQFLLNKSAILKININRIYENEFTILDYCLSERLFDMAKILLIHPFLKINMKTPRLNHIIEHKELVNNKELLNTALKRSDLLLEKHIMSMMIFSNHKEIMIYYLRKKFNKDVDYFQKKFSPSDLNYMASMIIKGDMENTKLFCYIPEPYFVFLMICKNMIGHLEKETSILCFIKFISYMNDDSIDDDTFDTFLSTRIPKRVLMILFYIKNKDRATKELHKDSLLILLSNYLNLKSLQTQNGPIYDKISILKNLGLSENFSCRIYSLSRLIKIGYLKTDKSSRFFNIISRLPLEICELISRMAYSDGYLNSKFLDYDEINWETERYLTAYYKGYIPRELKK